MKLYQSTVTPNSRRVRIFLAEKGISLPQVEVDLANSEHKQTAFAKINPLHQVPALELDDGTIITESLAICRYFEEMQPKPALFGATPLERVQIEMWQRRMEFGLLLPVLQVFRHSHPAMAEMEKPQVAQWAEANKPRVTAALTLLDEQLQNHRFIVGERYSVADITALTAMGFMRPARLEVPQGLMHLARWLNEVSDRPSAKA